MELHLVESSFFKISKLFENEKMYHSRRYDDLYLCPNRWTQLTQSLCPASQIYETVYLQNKNKANFPVFLLHVFFVFQKLRSPRRRKSHSSQSSTKMSASKNMKNKLNLRLISRKSTNLKKSGPKKYPCKHQRLPLLKKWLRRNPNKSRLRWRRRRT